MYVYSLALGKDGKVYYGGGTGYFDPAGRQFAVYDPATNTSTNLTGAISAFWGVANVNALVAASDKRVFLGGDGARLAVYDPVAGTASDLSPAIAASWGGDKVLAMAPAAAAAAGGGDLLYLGSDKGRLATYDPATRAVTPLTSAVAAIFGTQSILAIAVAPDGRVVLGGASGKLALYVPAQATAYDLALAAGPIFGQNPINALLFIRTGELFVAGNNAKLARVTF